MVTQIGFLQHWACHAALSNKTKVERPVEVFPRENIYSKTGDQVETKGSSALFWIALFIFVVYTLNNPDIIACRCLKTLDIPPAGDEAQE